MIISFGHLTPQKLRYSFTGWHVSKHHMYLLHNIFDFLRFYNKFDFQKIKDSLQSIHGPKLRCKGRNP